jgi:hypothetical protein
MNVTAMEDEVLGRCADDYEAPHTITSDIARDLERPITEAEVRAAFVSLAAKGLVQAYVYEASNSRYVEISSIAAAGEATAWFFITSDGRKVMNDEAS